MDIIPAKAGIPLLFEMKKGSCSMTNRPLYKLKFIPPLKGVRGMFPELEILNK
tara:strand:- start:174 stop:332 length:159 start_codon:yes stop_codon:yes gene_type:complete